MQSIFYISFWCNLITAWKSFLMVSSLLLSFSPCKCFFWHYALQSVRAYRRNSGARGKFLFRGPYLSQKCWRAGEGGGRGGGKNFPRTLKKGSKTFSGQRRVKSVKVFPKNSCRNMGKTNFFGISVKFMSRNSSDTIIYISINVLSYFLSNFANFGAP